ncbi:signal transduction histidine kinase [Glaciihabitans tibetensis]|uniref:Signal transduction histidine kinase n=1 Tax=Glaciihabitans tibetensis TaxID=1266600 RepID=A0A2T0VHI3_9MICO|nr:histidine kinase [Glaciihabitans tibetensis]PRY69533.1 signal transduction histidine kinase [Glaciihabitans tibetensis]
MDLIFKERDRLLRRTARLIGLIGTAVSVVSLSLAPVVPPGVLLEFAPFLASLVIALVMVGRSEARRWIALGLVAGSATLVIASIAANGPLAGSLGDLRQAVVPLAAVALASFALAVPATIAWLVVMTAVAGASLALVQSSGPPQGFANTISLSVLLGWALIVVIRSWLRASMPRAARRIHSIGKAHRVERLASETEAQRRQSARLLHDTVLATLTLLAHSGVGVAPAALQQQAADDARLLRQLRLGATPTPQSSGVYNLEQVEEFVLGTTLESVKQRFGRMGLEVTWHGTGQVLLPSDVLDAFLLALAECLENVRRHSGVRRADVTITDDATTVRALVTDAGVGFELVHVDEDKLGFKESVVARLREVGGNARLFSSAGAGTTVVLEVPK